MGRHWQYSHQDLSASNPQFVGSVFVIALCLAGMFVGCARSTYRKAADKEAYCLIESRQSDPRWDLPGRRVEPNRRSRMYVAAERDCAPKPLDDRAAHQYMVKPDCKDIPYYQQIATRSNIENPHWLDHLPRNTQGEIELSQPLAIELGLIHSRDYQAAFEQVYLSALNLSGNRFEFDTQWFGGGSTAYRATGSDLGGDQILTLSDRLGFSRNLAGGGQFATQMINSLSWNFGAGGIQQGSASIVAAFTQPLLRGAFRHVRLENLTQAERNLLYQVRDFARFRRQFYVNLTENYLGLLTQSQAIRNIETNVINLRQNLDEHQFLFDLEFVSQVQVDQVFQEYQNGRRRLLTVEQDYLTSQDQYKFSLGLPAWLTFQIDESLLEPFELVDPNLVQLQDQAQELYESLVQYLPPKQRAPVETLKTTFEEYKQLRERVANSVPMIQQDLQLWKQRINAIDPATLSENDRLDLDPQIRLADQLERTLAELSVSLAGRQRDFEQIQEKLDQYEQNPPSPDQSTEEKPLKEILQQFDSMEDVTIDDILQQQKDDIAVESWKLLEDAIGSQLRQEIAELYVAQTQIKLFLIDIAPFSINSETAITFAHQNRLDLMNARAQVMDAFRRVEVAADALESDLDVTGGVRIGSDANSNNPFKFDSANNEYTLGLQFDGPLNRLNERNQYRASQIAYQEASRDYMARKDQVANEVRQILRRLELSRLNFQIARQQVVSASRLVDQAQIDLRQSPEANSNLTIVLLGALEGMLDAKNSLIGNWVSYRIQKMRLFEALELLYLDENGNWINEDTGLDALAKFKAIDPEYFPPELFGNTSAVLPAPIATPQSDRMIESDIENLESISVESADAAATPEILAAPINGQ